MEHKATLNKILLIAVGIFIFAVSFAFLAEKYNDFGLYWATTEAIVLSLGFFSIITFFISLTLLFLREEVFRSWLRFTKWYLPISAVILIWSAMSGSSGGWGMPNFFDSEMMSWFTSGLFLVTSIILIVTKSIQLRGKK